MFMQQSNQKSRINAKKTMFQYTDYSINEALKKSLSSRLLDLLAKKGYKNSRKPYYVDVIKFASELTISTTMLRRYLSCMALPPFEVVERASKILDVDPLWLLCGYEQAEIDQDLLKQLLKKMMPIFIKVSSISQKELDAKIDYLCEIYQHISVIKTTDDIEKHKLIGWMLEKILTDEMLPATGSSKVVLEHS